MLVDSHDLRASETVRAEDSPEIALQDRPFQRVFDPLVAPFCQELVQDRNGLPVGRPLGQKLGSGYKEGFQALLIVNLAILGGPRIEQAVEAIPGVLWVAVKNRSRTSQLPFAWRRLSGCGGLVSGGICPAVHPAAPTVEREALTAAFSVGL